MTDIDLGNLSSPTTGLAPGVYTYYAVATDAGNVSSTVASTTPTVTAVSAPRKSPAQCVLGFNVDGQNNFGTQGLHASTVATGRP